MQIPERIIQTQTFLEELAKSKSVKKRRTLFDKASDSEISILCDIIFNLLKSNFNVSNRQRRTLQPYAPTLRSLSRVKTAKTARKILNQKGGSLPLAAFIVPLLAEITSQLLKK